MSEAELEPQKKIIHVDMDCFYAAVEMRDNPSLKDIPLAIGGDANRRGVISTCNYVARKYGIRSAMPTARAKKLCPRLTVIRGDMAKYKEVSRQIRAIFERYTDKIEPLSLDEAYLDVTGSSLYQGSATLIAEAIRRDIASELNLTASAGVAPVKFVAKVASDINKPNGICVVTPDDLPEFVRKLPLEKIPGVGHVTLGKLHDLGLKTCEDIQHSNQQTMIQHFGKFGVSLWQRSHGIDRRGVVTERVRKSLGVERTLSADILTPDECWNVVESLYDELETRLARVQSDKRVLRQGVKLKFDDFQQTTVEHTHPELEKEYFKPLLQEALGRQKGRGIRLVGLVVGICQDGDVPQLSFGW